MCVCVCVCVCVRVSRARLTNGFESLLPLRRKRIVSRHLVYLQWHCLCNRKHVYAVNGLKTKNVCNIAMNIFGEHAYWSTG
jgi:hypothetical protein